MAMLFGEGEGLTLPRGWRTPSTSRNIKRACGDGLGCAIFFDYLRLSSGDSDTADAKLINEGKTVPIYIIGLPQIDKQLPGYPVLPFLKPTRVPG